MPESKRKLLITDVSTDAPSRPSAPTKDNVPKLSDDFGRDLSTVSKARQWLVNPHNWHQSDMWVCRWNGLLVTINEKHGRYLIERPDDNGLPEVVVREQYRLRQGGKNHDEPEGE